MERAETLAKTDTSAKKASACSLAPKDRTNAVDVVRIFKATRSTVGVAIIPVEAVSPVFQETAACLAKKDSPIVLGRVSI